MKNDVLQPRKRKPGNKQPSAVVVVNRADSKQKTSTYFSFLLPFAAAIFLLAFFLRSYFINAGIYATVIPNGASRSEGKFKFFTENSFYEFLRTYKVWNDKGIRIKNFHINLTNSALWYDEKSPNSHFFFPAFPRVQVLDYPGSPISGKNITLKLISESPRMFFVENFISEKECEDLLFDALDIERNPTAMDPDEKNGPNFQETGIELSYARVEDTFVAAKLLERATQLFRLDPTRDDLIEGVEIERYALNNYHATKVNSYPENKYLEEGFSFNVSSINGSNIYGTLILYLTDKFKGGQTAFPEIPIETVDQDTFKETRNRFTTSPVAVDELEGFSDIQKRTAEECNDRRYTSIQPKRGSVILFYSIFPNNKTIDHRIMHAGCPIFTSFLSKYSANIFAWTQCRFGYPFCKYPVGSMVDDGF